MINDALAGIAGLVVLWLAFELWSHWYGKRQAARHNAEAAKIIADERRELARQSAQIGKPVDWPKNDEIDWRNYLDHKKLEVQHETHKGEPHG